MKSLHFLALSLVAFAISSPVLSECSSKTLEIIKSPGAGGGNKEKAIAFVQSALRDHPEKRDKNIALIKACTESDLASISPPNAATPAKGNQVSSPRAPFSSATTSSNQGKQSIAKCGRKSPVIQNSVAIYKEDWIEIVQDSPLKIVELSRFGEDGMLNKSEPYSLDISYAIDNLERGLRIHCEGPGCANLRNGQKQRIEWLQCLNSVFEAKTLASNQGIKSSSEPTANSGGAAQLNTRSDRMTTSSSNASDTTIQKGEAKGGRRESPTAKYVSKDATHCVEVVTKGFKCDGPYDRFLTNICMTKISVRWRLGSDPWGMQELAPNGCTPVSPFRDQRSVQFKACSWDPKASHGPYSNPCRY